MTLASAYDSWQFDLTEDYNWPAVAPLDEINRHLVTQSVIYKTPNGKFFLRWRERHPEMISAADFFGGEEFIPSDEAVLAEYRDLQKRMPYSDHETEISRGEAWHLIAWFWLPREFHGEAGLPPAG